MSSRADDVKQAAEAAAKNKKTFQGYINTLVGSSRRDRQNAASVVAEVARIAPDRVVQYAPELIESLSRPEAQTRWEVLDALTEICALDARACDKAIDGAENGLFDEDSGPLRLASMKFLCKYGATTENRSEKVWSLIDEAIQCYHGDIEYSDMLNALVEFSTGKLSPTVKEEFTARMAFDAANSKGSLGKRSALIVENLKAKKK